MTENSFFLGSFGQAMLNHLWQSTLFAAAVWLVTLLLRRNPAKIRFWLWLAASAKFLIPFSLLIRLGSLFPKPSHVAAYAPRGVYSTVDAFGQPFSDLLLLRASTPQAPSFAKQLITDLPLTLAIIWLCGVIIVLLVWWVRWRQISAILSRSVPLEGGREVKILRGLGGPAHISVRVSQELMEPGVFGVVRPVLMWPDLLSERLQDEHIEGIMAHELMHVRRRDNLIAMLHMGVEAIFWFHPLVWWMERRMVEERERACDEAVVQIGGKPEIYAESLLKACRFCVESPLTCIAGITGADLKMRIRSIMTVRLEQLKLGQKMILAAFGLIAVAAPILFGMLHIIPLKAVEAEAQSPSEPDWQKAAGGKMSFDVASIRPSKPGAFTPPNFPLSADNSYVPTGGIFTADFPLEVYIQFAYKLNWSAYQRKAMLAQLPKWVSTDNFEIHAKAPSSNPTKDQMRLMVQSLLTDRFKLAIHFESQQVPVLALSLIKPGKPGPKLIPHADGPPCSVPTKPLAEELTKNAAHVFLEICDMYMGHFTPNHMLEVGSRNTTPALIAAAFSSMGNLDRPVIDHTGLSGRFDFSLEWTPEPGTPIPPGESIPADAPKTTFLEALKEQLGLKLEPTIAPLDILIVDHIELPSEN